MGLDFAGLTTITRWMKASAGPVYPLGADLFFTLSFFLIAILFRLFYSLQEYGLVHLKMHSFLPDQLSNQFQQALFYQLFSFMIMQERFLHSLQMGNQ